MRAAAIAILSVLVMFPAQAGQRHRQIVSSVPSCDNDGRCTTFNAGVARIYSGQTRRKMTRTAGEPAKANTAVTLTGRSDPEVTTEEITVATPVATGAAEMTRTWQRPRHRWSKALSMATVIRRRVSLYLLRQARALGLVSLTLRVSKPT
jgi:hypothetical protein